MKLNLYNLSGDIESIIEVPIELEYIRKDIIRRAVLSEESYTYQPKGNYKWAGMDTSAKFVGREAIYRSLKDQGQARLPRELLGGGRYGRVRIVPHSVKGRRAHPPKPEKIIIEKINKKEKKLALLHSIFGAKLYIIKDLDNLKKTKEAKALLEKFLELDEERKRITGVRKRRKKRAYKEPIRATVVTKEKTKAFQNIVGVKYKIINELQVRDIAPGGVIDNRNLFISYKAFVQLLNEFGVKL